MHFYASTTDFPSSLATAGCSRARARVRPAILLLALLATSAVSSAQMYPRHYVFVEDWFKPAGGVKELELHWEQAGAHDQSPSVEFEYGVNGNYTIDLGLGADRIGNRFRGNDISFEHQYRFGSLAFKKLLPAIHMQFNKHANDPELIETNFIGAYLPSSDWTLTGNLIYARTVRRPDDGSKIDEWGYALGLSHSWANGFVGSVEAFGDWNSNVHYVGPTVKLGLGQSDRVFVGTGFSFAGKGPTRLKIVLEHFF